VLHAHERAVTRLEQKICIHKDAEQRIAYGGVEAPEAARLCSGKAQSRHFEELALDAPELFVCWSVWLGHDCSFTSHDLLVQETLEIATDMPLTFPQVSRGTASPQRKTGLISLDT
jgi:hypothetical protein